MPSALLLILAAAVPSTQEPPYSAAELTALLQPAEDLARRGRFLQAAAKLREAKKERIPAGDAARVRELERKVGGYASLLLETTAGDTLESPALTRIAIKNAGKPLGRIVRSDELFLHYETLTGIRSRLSKELVDTLTPLTPQESAAEVLAEFRRQC